MTIVILALPGNGHVNPTVPSAEALVARGQRVVYFQTDEFVAAARATGAEFQPLGAQCDMSAVALPAGAPGPLAAVSRRAAKRASFLARVRDVSPALRERVLAAAPDVVVYDVLGIWVRGFLETTRAPRAAFFPTDALAPGDAPGWHRRRWRAPASTRRSLPKC